MYKIDVKALHFVDFISKKVYDSNLLCLLRGNKVKNKTQYLKFVLTYNLILLIPLLIINLSVLGMLKKYQYNKVSDEVRMTFDRQDDFLKNEIFALKNYADECKFNKIYNDLYFDSPSIYFDIEDNLKEQEMKSPFIDRVYMYDEKNGTVYSSSGTFSSELFFNNILRTDILNLEKVRQMAGHVLAFPAKPQGDKNDGILFAYAMRTWTKDGEQIKYFLFPVRDRKLRSYFEIPEGERIYLLNDKEILYSTESEKESYEDFVKNEKYEKDFYVWKQQMNCGFQYVRMIPEKIITNSMLIYLKGYGMWVFCSFIVGIVLAGGFSKVRYENYVKLIRHNEALKEERDELKVESCLYDLLRRKIYPEDETWNKCLECNIRIERKSRFFILVSDQILERKEDYEWFVQQINQNDITDAYRIDLVDGILIYLVCSDSEKSKLEETIQNFLNRDILMGISDVNADISELKYFYQQAKERLFALNKEENCSQYPEREVSSLKTAVDNSDVKRAGLLLDELLDVIEAVDDIMSSVILWEVSEIFKVDREQLLRLQKDNRDDLKAFSIGFLKEMKKKVETLKKRETEKNSGYKKRDIMDVLNYIYENYLDDNFSVKSMASHFQTSVSNISHFFKKNMEVTISQYVEQIKLERAKEMLKTSDKKVSEIAEILRYANSTAFIEMFKKYEGVTPGAYRESSDKEK